MKWSFLLIPSLSPVQNRPIGTSEQGARKGPLISILTSLLYIKIVSQLIYRRNVSALQVYQDPFVSRWEERGLGCQQPMLPEPPNIRGTQLRLTFLSLPLPANYCKQDATTASKTCRTVPTKRCIQTVSLRLKGRPTRQSLAPGSQIH